VGVIPLPFVTSIQVERKQLILPTVVLRGQQDLTNRKCKHDRNSSSNSSSSGSSNYPLDYSLVVNLGSSTGFE